MAFSSLADEVAIYLAGVGHGTKGTNLFVGLRPPTPAALVSVVQFGGGPPDSYLAFVEEVDVQVMCRAVKNADAEKKAYEIFEDLHGKTNLTWTGHSVMTITAIASPGYVGIERLEGADGHLWSCNYTFALRREAA